MPTAPLQDHLRTALHEATATLARAQQRGQPHELSAAWQLVARADRALGDLVACSEHLVQALRWARCSGAPDHVAELLCELCETAADRAEQAEARHLPGAHAARESARDHGFEACTLAPHTSDRAWEVRVLLRISDVWDRFGDHDDALQLQTRALRLMSARGALGNDPSVLPGLGRLADV